MKKTFKKELRNIYNWLLNNVIFILNMSYILCIIETFSFNKYNKYYLILLIVLFVILETFKRIITINRINKIPVLKEDLTYSDNEGNIVLEEGSLQKAIIYLNIIEKYIKDNNLR